ncbi:MAG: molybdenum cofactor biosynthesis protein MoaE [Acidimicrobiales bacterium]|nr:molybdenum cofactor biosynthesis protein MoaE [Acidimicrobiales bacterium]
MSHDDVARIQYEPLSLDDLTKRTDRPDCGALASFTGVVRDHHDGKSVDRLVYSAQEAIAQKMIRVIEAETIEHFGVAECLVVHRVGDLAIGDAAIVAVVRSGHRGEAFDAVRYVVDNVKTRVPIWKEEFYADGTSAFVEGCSLVHADSGRAAVIVLSDTVASGSKQDTAGAAVVERLKGIGFDVVHYEVLLDEPAQLSQRVEDFVDDDIELVITVGGTGVGPRDITVDTIKPLLTTELPGVMEAARAYGQARTPMAMLSRGIAGLIERTVVITFPGSRKGAEETFDAIGAGLPHLVEVVRKNRPHPGGYD